MRNILLLLHPSKVAESTLKLDRTFGLGWDGRRTYHHSSLVRCVHAATCFSSFPVGSPCLKGLKFCFPREKKVQDLYNEFEDKR